jgi:hypothetical protein
LLGRTIFSVRKRAKVYGLRKKKQKPVTWRPDELDYLTERYSTTKTSELSATLDRSPDSILWKAHNLNLRKAGKYCLERPKLAEWQNGYMAAFLDGEGSIQLYGVRKREGRNHHRLQVMAAVELTNTNRKVLETIAAWVGARQPVFKNGSLARYCYKLAMRNNRVLLWFLEQTLPYLIIKREKAEIVRDYLKIRVSKTSDGPASQARYGPEEFQLLEKFEKLRMKPRVCPR